VKVGGLINSGGFERKLNQFEILGSGGNLGGKKKTCQKVPNKPGSRGAKRKRCWGKGLRPGCGLEKGAGERVGASNVLLRWGPEGGAVGLAVRGGIGGGENPARRKLKTCRKRDKCDTTGKARKGFFLATIGRTWKKMVKGKNPCKLNQNQSRKYNFVKGGKKLQWTRMIGGMSKRCTWFEYKGNHKTFASPRGNDRNKEIVEKK